MERTFKNFRDELRALYHTDLKRKEFENEVKTLLKEEVLLSKNSSVGFRKISIAFSSFTTRDLNVSEILNSLGLKGCYKYRYNSSDPLGLNILFDLDKILAPDQNQDWR